MTLQGGFWDNRPLYMVEASSGEMNGPEYLGVCRGSLDLEDFFGGSARFLPAEQLRDARMVLWPASWWDFWTTDTGTV